MRMAIAQYDVVPDKDTNLETLAGYAAQAAEAGADLLVCPEAALAGFPREERHRILDAAESLDGPFATGVRKVSAETGVTVVVGIHELGDAEDPRLYNTVVVASGGEITAAYRKLHLYDAFSAKESDRIRPGSDAPVTFRCGDLTVGVVTCYDLRFPEIFRHLVDLGVDAFVVPAAWVRGSLKEAHWLTLLRARAIENTCYVGASGKINQYCIGRSTVFDPLGLQLADLGETPGLAIVDATAERIAEVRKTLPALEHRRYSVAMV